MKTLVAVVVVGVLVAWILKLSRAQESMWSRLSSFSYTNGWLRVAGDGGETNITGGSIWLAGPHGGPGLEIRAVSGRTYTYPYDRADGTVSQERGVRGSGFDIVVSTPSLPDMPLPPRIRLEFRDDTLTIRTWEAKIEIAEWRDGDGH